jgi:outer membrane protein OmpA-like peptidoglycan-associated protein
MPFRRTILPVCLLTLASSCAMLGGASKPNYIVFFQQRSAAIDPAAAAVIERAAAKAKTIPGSVVTVYGYTDSAGSPQADVVLSQQRAEGVAGALVADGVASAQIVRKGLGQTDEDPGIASRRVEINVGRSTGIVN